MKTFRGEKECMLDGWTFQHGICFAPKDNAIPIDLQEYMIGEAREMGADFTTRRLDADHSPFYSRPQETLDFIKEAISAMMSGRD